MAKRRRHVQTGRRRKGSAVRKENPAPAGWLGTVGSYLRQSWQRRRALSPRAILIWVTVAVVAGAFLLLLAQQALWLAVLAGLFVLGFSWIELTRPV